MDSDARPTLGATLLGYLLLLLALVPIVLWPLETCFCIDEPQLLSHAARANQESSIYITGLFGNFAVPYGPVPTQIYQLILVFTHDPATIVLIRALLCSLVTGLSLLWMARSLGLPQWFASALLFAPYVSEELRVLWDASFTIPIGSLALASFAAFVRTGGRWPMRFALAGSAQLLLIHPMSMPLALPIMGCLFWKYWQALWKDWAGIVCTALFMLVFHFHYFFVFYYALMWKFDHQGMSSYPKGPPHLEAAMAPFYGGNIFNGIHALPYPRPGYLEVLAKLSQVVYVLSWIGMAGALYCAYRGWRARACREEAQPLSIVCTVGLVGLLFQGALYGLLRIPAGPQYFFGTFALHAFFVWMGAASCVWVGRWAARRNLRGPEDRPAWIFRALGVLPGLFFLVVASSLTMLAVIYKHQHVEDAPVFPNLKIANDIVRELNRYDQLGAYSDIQYMDVDWFYYPQAVRALRLLLPPNADRIHPKGRLFVTFKKVDGRTTGKIEVIDLGDAPLPPGAYYFGTAPISELWSPDASLWSPNIKKLPPSP